MRPLEPTIHPDEATVRRQGGKHVLGALVAAVAVLLPAGIWSATAVDHRPVSRSAGSAVGLAGLSQSALGDEPAPSGPTVTVAPTSTTSSTVPATSSTTATTKPSPATTTTVPATSSSTTSTTALVAGNIAPASSWKADVPGLSVRLRMEPERPVVGQTVRFYLDVTSVDRCCHAFMNFNEGSGWMLHDKLLCTFEDELIPGPHSMVISHTYAKADAYRLDLSVHDGSMCEPFPAIGPPFRHIEIPACVLVGPNPKTTSCLPPGSPSPFPVPPVAG
jgi:hypothetical protein